MTTRHTLLVPVEIQAREFDAKLLFACFATERDLDVVVGQRAVIRNTIHKMPVGLYLDKVVAAGRVRIVRIIRGLGYNIAGWDEESLVQLSPEHYFKRRVIGDNHVIYRSFFAWGDPDGEKHALAAHHIASLDGPLASTRILDALERHMAENPLPVVDPANRRAALFKARRRGFEKRILSLIPGYHVNSRSYSRHRFPDITCSQVNRRIARFACVLKRFDGVKAEPMRRNVFKISRGPGP